jgi:hypothetical protein
MHLVIKLRSPNGELPAPFEIFNSRHRLVLSHTTCHAILEFDMVEIKIVTILDLFIKWRFLGLYFRDVPDLAWT